jgi:hypothetical protein
MKTPKIKKPKPTLSDVLLKEMIQEEVKKFFEKKSLFEQIKKSEGLHKEQIEDLLHDVHYAGNGNYAKGIKFSRREDNEYGMDCVFTAKEYPDYKFNVEIELNPTSRNKKGYIEVKSAEFSYKVPNKSEWVKLNIKNLKFPKILASEWEDALDK